MRRDIPAQTMKQKKETHSSFLCGFCSGRGLNRLDDTQPPCGGRSACSSLWLQCLSHLETPSWTHTEITFNHLAGQPLIQSSWHLKLTITVPKKRFWSPGYVEDFGKDNWCQSNVVITGATESHKWTASHAHMKLETRFVHMCVHTHTHKLTSVSLLHWKEYKSIHND